MIKRISIVIIGAGLLACSSVNTLSVDPGTVKLDQSFLSNTAIDSMIMPYKDSLSVEMNVVIAKAETDFVVSRPGSNLGNWVADAIFVNQTKTVRLSIPTFCILNTGGIRASLNKGDITVGDMYKLMPFDNEIVWVKLPISVLPEIEAYLIKSGGEPLAGATMVNGKLEIGSWRNEATHVWVITSDYLMNGGDKMNFFQKKEDINLTGKLMRDAMIIEAKEQGTLAEDTTVRISF
jgi:2',3'-cyclic-nucleotide 2'-phosphodiesterase (5'-nucleotidase family)